VAEQQRLIELLKEKRQAVISHAVTKGLNPKAPLKSSGIEWLGDVPEHWRVMPMRMIANIVRGASPRPAGDPRYFGGDAVPWVTVAEITKDESVFLTQTENFLTQEGATHSNLFRSGTLIYSNSGATLGVPKILSIDACANDGVVAFLNLNSQVQAEFLYQYLSSITENIREKVKQGSGQPNLNTDIVKDLRFGLPPITEQLSILQRIAKFTEQFDSLTTEAQRAIDLLQERRTALISAAVTGQIDVRPLTGKKSV
jgi:type I restriction enzyme S subunit